MQVVWGGFHGGGGFQTIPNQIQIFYRQLEKLMRTKSDQVEATHIAIVILPAHLLDVIILIRSHQLVQLLPQRVYSSFLFSISLSLEIFSSSITPFSRDQEKKSVMKLGD